MKYKIPQPIERQKYWAPDIPGDLESAYSLLAMTNPAGFRELVKFDRQQARRDQVYKQRHSRLNADYDRAVSDSGIEQVELVATMPLDDRCKSICTMLLQGYKQCDIACMFNISDARVSQLKAKIGKVLESGSRAASQRISQSVSQASQPGEQRHTGERRRRTP